jgi:hypothetical protein
MKKIHLIGLALFAVFAFSAVSVATASATELLWLVDGEPITAEGGEPSETEGELELSDLKTALGVAKVLCSGLFVGTVGPGAHDLITGVLNLNSEPIANGDLTGLALDCTNDGNCPSPLVWPENLPWSTTLELMGSELEPLFLDLFSEDGFGLPAWEVDCTEPLIGLLEDLCEGETSVDLENMPEENDVLGTFNAAELEAEGLNATCTLGGAGSGVVNSPAAGLIFVVGKVLSVSYD